MTNTDTADVEGTALQVRSLALAGSELVRVTVNTDEAAAAVPHIVEQARAVRRRRADRRRLSFQRAQAAARTPRLRRGAREVPDQSGQRRPRQQARSAVYRDDRDRLPLRQTGAHRRELGQPRPGPADAADGRELAASGSRSTRTTWCARRWSSRHSTARAAPRTSACAHDRIVISCKVSGVQDLIAVYRNLARRCDYALHLGLTEAGMGSKGIVASTAAMGVLLQEGIGDTIRVSLTPEPNGDRTQEVIVAQEMLQTMGLRSFTPMVIACPGCGRTTSTYFQQLAQIDPVAPAPPHARMAQALCRRRADDCRGDGLRRERAGREQARQHRHQPAGHRRAPRRARVHRRRRRARR